MSAGAITKQLPAWKGLSTLGVAIGYRCDNKEHESLEYRYYISSAALTEEQFVNGVRSHWDIENQLHWVLDVTMKENAGPIYRGNTAEILATARHMALNRSCFPNPDGSSGTYSALGDLITTSPFKSASWAKRFTPFPTGHSTTSP